MARLGDGLIQHIGPSRQSRTFPMTKAGRAFAARPASSNAGLVQGGGGKTSLCALMARFSKGPRSRSLPGRRTPGAPARKRLFLQCLLRHRQDSQLDVSLSRVTPSAGQRRNAQSDHRHPALVLGICASVGTVVFVRVAHLRPPRWVSSPTPFGPLGSVCAGRRRFPTPDRDCSLIQQIGALPPLTAPAIPSASPLPLAPASPPMP